MAKYRAYLLNLDDCSKELIGYYDNRFAAIKSANGYRLRTNESMIVQQLDEGLDRWFTIHSKFRRG